MLSDEQKRNLSAIAKGRSRDSKGRLLPATSAHEAKIDELEAQLARVTDEKRIAERAVLALVSQLNEIRDSLSITYWQRNNATPVKDADIVGGVRGLVAGWQLGLADIKHTEEERDSAIASEKQAHELLSALTKEVEAQGSARRLAEGRYVALLRRRSIEWGILITSVVGGIVIAGLFALVNGGAK